MVAWSNSNDPVTQAQMLAWSEELSQNLGTRQTEIVTKLDMADQMLKSVDQQFRILEQAMGARVISIEEALQKTMNEVVDHKDMIGQLRVTSMTVEIGMQELHDSIVNVNADLGSTMHDTVRNLEMNAKEVKRVNNVLAEADQCVKNLNGGLASVEQKSDKPGGNKSSLIDPKHVTVKDFDGKNVALFGEWRDTVERLVNAIFPGLKSVMKKISQARTKITEGRFLEVKYDLENEGIKITWDYHVVNDELGVYLLGKTTDKPKLTADGAKLAGGFEMWRLLHQRYDRVSEETAALMTAAITKLGAHQASNLQDLRGKLATLERVVENYVTKLQVEPDAVLLGSVLTTILDPQTRREFVNIGGILSKYDRIKEKIGELASDCSGPKAMDIGEFAPANPGWGPEPTNEPTLECRPCQALDEAQRRINENIICWTCNQKGHPSYLCPHRNTKGQDAKGGASKG